MVALLVTLAFSLYMTGMIWSMQVLEYPLFALVGPKEFPSYHRRHNSALPFLVIVPSLVAFVSALALIFTRPARLPLWATIVIAGLDLIVIIVTALREAPLHAKLDRDGTSPVVIRQLVQGNWARTVVWTGNALILIAVTGYLLGVTW
jgi:hypothetical protein